VKKIFQRLIVFAIGLPVLLSVIVFFPQHNHLLLNLVLVTFSVLGAVELRNILTHKKMVISVPEAVILGAICPATWTVVISFGINELILPLCFILGAFWILVSRTFTSEEKLDSYIGRTAAGFSLMIYPGFFISWIIQMAVLGEAGDTVSMIILIFFLMVLLNDAAAWLTGFLFGKNNRGLVPASPNKSVAGFIGGIAASVGIGIIAASLIPDAFTSQVMCSSLAAAILGLGAGVASALGDLCESAIKRSAGVKDSGALILGRGGALDSIDSLILAAPVYYFLYQLFF